MSAQHTTPRTTPPARSPAQSAARLVGVLFLLIGVFGFVAGVTQNLDLRAGGVFNAFVLHSVVHLTFGVLGLVAANRPSMARAYLLAGGVSYVGLWLYGLALGLTSGATLLPVGSPDRWLHLALGAAMVLLGLLLGRTRRTTVAHPWPA